MSTRSKCFRLQTTWIFGALPPVFLTRASTATRKPCLSLARNSGLFGVKPQLLISGFQSKRITSSSPVSISSSSSSCSAPPSTSITTPSTSSSVCLGAPSSRWKLVIVVRIGPIAACTSSSLSASAPGSPNRSPIASGWPTMASSDANSALPCGISAASVLKSSRMFCALSTRPSALCLKPEGSVAPFTAVAMAVIFGSTVSISPGSVARLGRLSMPGRSPPLAGTSALNCAAQVGQCGLQLVHRGDHRRRLRLHQRHRLIEQILQDAVEHVDRRLGQRAAVAADIAHELVGADQPVDEALHLRGRLGRELGHLLRAAGQVGHRLDHLAQRDAAEQQRQRQVATGCWGTRPWVRACPAGTWRRRRRPGRSAATARWASGSAARSRRSGRPAC